MAIFFDAPVEPDDLTTFVREVPVNHELIFSNMFPTRFFDTNEVDFAELTHTNRTARFRNWDGRLHVSKRDAPTESKVKLPPLSSSYNSGELERLNLEFARNGGTRRERLTNAVYNDAQNLTGEVHNRIELAWGDVLADGKLTLSLDEESGLEADFLVPAGNLVTAGVTWATTSTTALTDLVNWNNTYLGLGVGPAGQLRGPQAVYTYLLRNLEVIAAIRGTAAGATMVTMDELNALLVSLRIPPIGDPIDHALDVDGETTRVLAADKLLFLPANIADLGFTAYGVTATALELVNSNESDLSFEEAPGIVGVVEKVGPPYREFTFVDACALPILADSRRLMVADVVP